MEKLWKIDKHLKVMEQLKKCKNLDRWKRTKIL